MASCTKEGCETDIVYVTSPNGARLPIDSVPIPDAVIAERFTVLYEIDRGSKSDPVGVIAYRRKDGDYARAFEQGVRLHASHFATCIAPQMFSRGGKGRR